MLPQQRHDAETNNEGPGSEPNVMSGGRDVRWEARPGWLGRVTRRVNCPPLATSRPASLVPWPGMLVGR